jgi:hypothetical protein
LIPRRPIPACCAASVAVFGVGCARTVLVNDSAPIRIGPGVSARIYLYNGSDWELSPNAVPLPEGFYLVPPRFVDGPEEAPAPQPNPEPDA